jgi:hypothetical protein
MNSSFSKEQKLFCIEFKDKDSSLINSYRLCEQTYINRANLGLTVYQYSDLPIKPNYMDSIKKIIRSQLLLSLKWLNACYVEIDDKAVEKIKTFNFVKSVQEVLEYQNAGTIQKKCQYKYNKTQNKLLKEYIECFSDAGLNGNGVTIGVIDAGFENISNYTFLKNSYEKGHILFIKDFLNEVSEKKDIPQDNHGIWVLEKIVGMDKKHKYGFATEAKLVLARTENPNKESRIEELLWAKALEWMDSLGIRLINSSLGYSTGFDDPKENYEPKNMDGNTAFISKIAKIAAEHKGLIIVSSCGNEGNKKNWRIVTAPADVEWVISVGALNHDFTKANYSSIGPDFVSYLKPNFCVFSSQGTSFSAPLITGMIACMLQKKPYLSLAKIRKILEKSAHLYPFPNNYVGYGMPNACKVIKILNDVDDTLHLMKKITLDVKNIPINELLNLNNGEITPKIQRKINFPEQCIFYYKINPFIVAYQTKKRVYKKTIIKKWDEFNYLTLVLPQKMVIEIEWIN